LPKAEWLREIKEEEFNGVIKQFKSQIKSKKYFAKQKYTILAKVHNISQSILRMIQAMKRQ